jgi:UDP-N-acetylglucosamine 2-epimerase (non-hydrolysing)
VKILTVLGTRPEIVRLSVILPLLDEVCEHETLYTGQNYDHCLHGVFTDGLGLRPWDHEFAVGGGTFADQFGQIMVGLEALIRKQAYDRVLILGDTNSSTAAAIVAKRLGVPVYHMEAGNRCFDDRVPEEVNRRIVDQCSDVLLPYTERSRQNLLREGIASDRIFVTGNPIYEVMQRFTPDRDVHDEWTGKFFVATLHRQENVDDPVRLRGIIEGLGRVALTLPVVLSVHPRLRRRLDEGAVDMPTGIEEIEPVGFREFVRMEWQALAVLTDSGTVQEECAILGTPTVTLRDTTERPETIECGSNILSGGDPESIACCARRAAAMRTVWTPPAGYLDEVVSEKVVNILLSFRL